MGISSLNRIIREGNPYADKTKFVCELVNTGACDSLSRLRRFGKTPFTNTLEECFAGNRGVIPAGILNSCSKEE